MLSTLALAPLSALYGAAVRARASLYRKGVLRQERAEAPVVSVGNITAGGTGKTPLVEWFARALAREGLRPCVLTRGYGRKDERARVVVSDGQRILADAREGGDEPRLLAEKLLGKASVVSCADRASASRWAFENLASNVFVLDDGFQHLRLARDFDVIALDATSPWGGGRMLPLGRLREPREALKRADCIIVTRADLAQNLESLREEVARITSAGGRIFEARARTVALRSLADDAKTDEAKLKAVQPFAAFCATGNPKAFFAHLRAEGFALASTRAFRDHHVYKQEDVTKLAREAVEAGAHAFLTTAKDAVKLRGMRFELPVYIIEIEMEIADEGALLELLRKAISLQSLRA